MELEVTKAHDARSSVMSLVRSCAILAVVIAPTSIVVAGIATRAFSPQSLVSAAIGGGICWLAGALALSATYLCNQFHAPVQGVLVGMAFRMGLPLAGLIVLPQLGGPLGASSVTATVLGVYLVGLVAETVLALRMVPPQTAQRQAVVKAT